MNFLEYKLDQTRKDIKKEIVELVKEIYYLKHNDYPQMFNDANGDADYYDNWIIEVRDLSEYASVLVEITSSDDDYNTYERYPIWEYIVTLDDDLYFYPAELGEEFHWEEINTDDLMGLYNHLFNNKSRLA